MSHLGLVTDKNNLVSVWENLCITDTDENSILSQLNNVVFGTPGASNGINDRNVFYRRFETLSPRGILRSNSLMYVIINVFLRVPRTEVSIHFM